ncbi:ATP-binding cassette domain-containing protein [Lactococcus nasutitermitis]|uniref:ATP-binding cassette domain-containing protein n=1 Tax=Lactococcus nasutitermitis TaxID=1652957 RepID=A0ABV9JG48_9LACT|nr:ABC transporter ATP-binding protein [Lactococcus nasutitermitis]
MWTDIKILNQYVPKRKLILFIIATFSNAFLNLATALIIQQATEMQGENSVHKIIVFGLSSMLLYAYVAISFLFINYIETSLVYSVSIGMKKTLLKIFTFRKTEFKNSEKISILTNDMQLFIDRFLMQILDIPIYIIMFGVPLIYMLSQNWLMGLLFGIGSITLPFPQILLNKKLSDWGKQLSEKKAVLLQVTSDEINGRTTIIYNNSLTFMLKYGEKKIKDSENAWLWSNVWLQIALAFSMLLKGVVQIVPFIMGFLMIVHGGNLSFAVLLALFLISQQMGQPIQQILLAFSRVQTMKKVCTKIFNILNDNQEISISNLSDSPKDFESLVIRHLSKSFGEIQIFDNFSYTIPFGAKILIKGKSGSGKSTLLKLITDDLQTDQGEIFLQQHEQKTTLSPKDFGVINQEPFIFNGSLTYNLCLEQAFTKKELLEVLEAVHLEEFSLDYLLINNGENLSGGQKIRLELARFLLRKKKLLLVDEVTAALDDSTAKAVRSLIYSLPITIIEVAHHIDDESRYDDIILLERRGTDESYS